MARDSITGPYLSRQGFDVGTPEAPINIIDPNGQVKTPGGIVRLGSNGELILPVAASAPTNAKYAEGTLTISGVVSSGETVTIGTDVFEFNDVEGNVGDGNNWVDISAGTKTQATGVFTLFGPTKDGETLTIGGETYEVDTDGSVGAENTAVDLSAAATAAFGVLGFSGPSSDGETITIGAKVYELDTNGAFTAGRIRVDISDDQSGVATINALVAIINSDITSAVTADGDTVAGTLTITHKVPGADGNEVAVDTTCDNASWGVEVGSLENGADPAAIASATAIANAITANTALDITVTDNGDGTFDVDADAAGALDGSAGNVAVSTTCAKGAFDAATLTGGSDATAAEAVTALVDAITTAAIGITAEDGAGDTVNLTHETIGAAGNAVVTTTTCANGAFGADNLEGGQDGTVGLANQAVRHGNYLYLCTAANSATGANWIRFSGETF